MIGNVRHIFTVFAGLLVFIFFSVFACRFLKFWYTAQTELNESTRTSAYAEVIDKGAYPTLIGKVVVTTYRLAVDVGGEEYKVSVPASLYNNVEIGNDIEVTIFHKDDKIVHVTYGNLEEEDNKSSKRIKAQKCHRVCISSRLNYDGKK